jgi:hypothetical protein
MDNSEQISLINAVFMEGLKTILGGKLHAAYVFGAVAFSDSLPTGDIDFHVILNEPLTSDEKRQLEAFHEDLGQRFPPLGGELDGYYILNKDSRKRTPPQSQLWVSATDYAWAIHRAHILAGRFIKLYGRDPREIYPPTTWDELEQALLSELWFVRDHLFQYPDYCIPGFYAAESVKERPLKKSPTFSEKFDFLSQLFINLKSKSPLFTHFG